MTAAPASPNGRRDRQGDHQGRRSAARAPRGGVHVALVVLMVVWLVPTIGLLVNSFRPAQAVASTGWWNGLAAAMNTSPRQLRARPRPRAGIGDAFINSLFISIPATIIPIFVAAFAAYAFSWMSFPGRNILFVAVVGLLVVPLQTTLIPILILYAGWGINGQFLAVWLAHTGYGLPFAIYLLRNFMGSLPREVFESAAIDGASPVTAFFRLAIPMSVPALAALAIFQFLFVWNDLLVAIIYIGFGEPGEPAADRCHRQPGELARRRLAIPGRGCVPLMALPLVVFFGLQRYFVRGIVGGSVKG